MFKFELAKSNQIEKKKIRTIKTERGTDFVVFAETKDFVSCYEPTNADTISEALLDIQFMYENGYLLVAHNDGYVIFKKT